MVRTPRKRGPALNRRTLLAGLSVPLLAGWSWPWQNESHRSSLILSGASRMLSYNEWIADQFEQAHHDADIVCDGSGAYPAMLALLRGAIDVAVINDELGRRIAYEKLAMWLVAKDAIAIIVNPDNPIDSLTPAQLRSILEGRATSWSTFGGRDEEIDVLDRAGGDPSDRQELEEVVLGHREPFRNVWKFVGSDEEMKQAVIENRDAIGYCGQEDVIPEVKVLAINGVPMTRETILSGRYSYGWPYYYVTARRPDQVVSEFIDFVLSDTVQAQLEKDGLLRVA